MDRPAIALKKVITVPRTEGHQPSPMTFARGRFAPSAEHGKAGMTVLVPRPVVDAEQRELMSFLTSAKVQNLIIFLRRGGVRHLDINERLGKAHGEYQGYAPLHVAALTGTSSVVSALLELGSADPDVLSVRFLETPLHLAAKKGDVGMARALLTAGARPDSKDKQGLTPLLVAASSSTMSPARIMSAAPRWPRSGTN